MKTRAAVAFEDKKPLEIVELDLDGPKAGEVLIEIMATGICHTDAYTLDGLDSEGDFFLQRPFDVDVLGRRADAEGLVLEDLVSHVLIGEQSGTRDGETGLADVLGRHINDAAVRFDFKRNALAVEVLADLASFLEIQTAIEKLHVGTSDPIDDQPHTHDRRHRDGDQ